MLDPKLKKVPDWKGGDDETREHLQKLTDLANGLLQVLMDGIEGPGGIGTTTAGTPVTHYKTIVTENGDIQLWKCTSTGTELIEQVFP